MPDKKKRVFIVDGYGQIYRSYFAFLTNPLKDKDGNNVSAVFGFFNTVMMLVRQYRPEYLVVAMDSRGKTFRHEMYDQYKANRDKAPDDLHAQVPVIDDFLEKMHIPHYERQGMEADDIIATIARKASLACRRANVALVIMRAASTSLCQWAPMMSRLCPYSYPLSKRSSCSLGLISLSKRALAHPITAWADG